jgi:hypothetical protein
MQKALADPQNEFPEEIRKGLASTLKVKEQVVMMMTREATEHMGIMAAGLLPCPIDFLILEQSRVYKELETVMSTEAFLDRESPKSVSLSLSLVPCAGADKTTGQWLYTSLSFVNADTRLIPPYELPEITHFHFARADPENGYDVELPPNGKASPRAVAFVLKRVPQVAQILKDRFGLTVKLVRCGQGLVNLTGPNGPDDANEIGIGPGGIPQFLPSIESREEPAREFRQIDLGPESERLWCTWDDFSRDIKVLPAHSTYANEKAAGRDATLGDAPFS